MSAQHESNGRRLTAPDIFQRNRPDKLNALNHAAMDAAMVAFNTAALELLGDR